MLSILFFCGAVLAKSPTIVFHAPYAEGPDETPMKKFIYPMGDGSNSGDVLGDLRVGDYIVREKMDECQFDACSYTGVLLGERGLFKADLCPDGKISHVLFVRPHQEDNGAFLVGFMMDEGWRLDLQAKPETIKDGSTRTQFIAGTKGAFERTFGSSWDRAPGAQSIDWVSTNEISCE